MNFNIPAFNQLWGFSFKYSGTEHYSSSLVFKRKQLCQNKQLPWRQTRPKNNIEHILAVGMLKNIELHQLFYSETMHIIENTIFNSTNMRRTIWLESSFCVLEMSIILAFAPDATGHLATILDSTLCVFSWLELANNIGQNQIFIGKVSDNFEFENCFHKY